MARHKLQTSFDYDQLADKRFTMKNLVSAKFDRLSNCMDKLSHSDVIWLSRVEDFYLKNEYVTERQVQVLDSIVKKYASEARAC